MEKRNDVGLAPSIAELRDYLCQRAVSPEMFDLGHAVELLKWCDREDGSPWSSQNLREYINCCVVLLVLL